MSKELAAIVKMRISGVISEPEVISLRVIEIPGQPVIDSVNGELIVVVVKDKIS
jgi:hypothetical protein